MKPIKLISKTAFKRLSKASQRVAIARDVLLRIKHKLIKPDNGNLIGNIDTILINAETSKEVQKALNSQTCAVCAKGSLMVAWVGAFNDHNASALWNFDQTLNRTEDCPTGLLNLFGKRLLAAIETAFEGKHYGWNESSDKLTLDEIDEIVERVGGNTIDDNGYSRGWPLDRIMKNLIKNRGKLKVGKLTFA